MNVRVLIAGIILIVVLGFGGLLYRNVVEHRSIAGNTNGACTLEVKECPDGTTVGRTGPSCSFAACPPPNVSLDVAKIAFALPAGYNEDKGAGQDIVAAYTKLNQASSSPLAAPAVAATITIYDYPLTGSTSANDVIVAHTTFEPSDQAATDMSNFTPRIIGTETFSEVTLERYEGVVESAYFLPRASDVLEFAITEHGVTDWTNPDLIPDNLPEHKGLIEMLGTLDDLSSQQ